jgi:two-component system nitrate/nitrite response regulator NarL
MSEPARVLIGDSHAPTREGLASALDADRRFCVCATTGDAAATVESARRERPDLCLLEVGMPGNGIAATWEITACLPATRVVMLNDSRADADLFAALRAGARGYLLKRSSTKGLVDSLSAVMTGEVAISPELVARLAEEFRDRAPRRRSVLHTTAETRLTSREWEVLDLIRKGMTTAEVARWLFISQATVRSHVASTLRKLHVPDRRAAIRTFEQSLR